MMNTVGGINGIIFQYNFEKIGRQHCTLMKGVEVEITHNVVVFERVVNSAVSHELSS